MVQEVLHQQQRCGSERSLGTVRRRLLGYALCNVSWRRYCHVFRRIAKQMTVLSDLELPVVSPRLVNARNLVLAVPGTYQAGKPVVNIAQFDPVLKVIESKQRPR